MPTPDEKNKNAQPANTDGMLDGFEDASAIIRKGLLNVNEVDYSKTNVSYKQEPDGSFRVEWTVDDPPMIDFIKRTWPFIGGVLLIIIAVIVMYFFSGPGPILLGIALIGWAGYCFAAGYFNRQEKYTFLVGIDNFSVVHDRIFHVEKLYEYNNLKGFELLATGTEDTWGLTMGITEKLGRDQITGKKESVELLCKTLEVFFRSVKAKRKKLGKGDEFTVVGQ